MVGSSNRVPEPKLFSSWGRDPSTSSPIQRSFVAISRDTETPRSSRYILPKDLDTAIQQLDDQELERLVSAALEERARRKKPSVSEKSHRIRDAEAVSISLPQGKLNAIRAAFKAGVTPNRIAREFGLSRSDVQRALAGEARKRNSEKCCIGLSTSISDRIRQSPKTNRN
jgi:hypothetical protein